METIAIQRNPQSLTIGNLSLTGAGCGQEDVAKDVSNGDQATANDWYLGAPGPRVAQRRWGGLLSKARSKESFGWLSPAGSGHGHFELGQRRPACLDVDHPGRNTVAHYLCRFDGGGGPQAPSQRLMGHLLV